MVVMPANMTYIHDSTSSLGLEDDLPYEVALSIHRVLNLQQGPDADPLDALSSSFSPIDILNKLFPDESSLLQVDAVQARLAEDAQNLHIEITSLRDELQRDQDPNRMQLVQDMVSDLMGQMSRIREKATESEAVVRNITKDIQLLDLSKKNLILSMTTLKRFQMLANALSQLEQLVKETKYVEIAQTLAAVKQLSTSFKPYLTVPRIAQTWARIQALQGELRIKLDHDFNSFFLPDPSKPIKLTVINSACAVVDVLDDDFRGQLIERYCAIELKEYRRIFRATDEAGHLDNISRRFAFFRRLLQTHDKEHARVFPMEWKVGHYLCAKFTEITRDDMTMLLDKAGSTLTVAILLETLQQVTDFEAYISKKYAMPFSEVLKLSSTNPSRSVKTISSAFEPHLGVFVDAQDKALSDMLATHRGTKSRPSLEAIPASASESSSSTIVLPSSTELFYFYGQTLEQCAKLSTGKSLFDLSTLHKKWLKMYAEDVLLASMRKQVNVSRRSMDVRFDLNELKNACLLINTADYCQATALELEEKIREKINSEFKGKITFQPERDLFISVISTAIIAQLREFESACEGSFATMMKTSWTNVEHVSGSSAYIDDLVRGIDQVAEVIRPLVEQKKYFRNFCDKAAGLILTRFTNALVKSRPLKEIGAEQLLFDLQALNACLLKLQGEPSTTSTYARGVSKSTGRLEKLLKVIIIPAEPPEGFILNYTLLIGDASFSNFQKVLDLKGTPRAEQNNLLDSFVAITSTKSELENTSFLSSLDMEPVANTQISNLVSPGGSRVSLPSLLAGTGSAAAAAEGIFNVLGSPPISGPTTGSDTGSKGGEASQKREVFSDLRRFVTFGLRRDTASS